MRHFFFEAFRSPPAWHAARLAHTRSVAVACMAGYLIGLGDRHSHNILVDAASAEVVHIDLGVAFEQGHFLRTPEVVPFRLTRDVVDGAGVSGVGGVLARCCGVTLAVLRGHRDALLTVVEVLIYDPLYRWQLSQVVAHRRQSGAAARGSGGGRAGGDGGAPAGAGEESNNPLDTGDLINADAQRALLRVRQKLSGLDGGDGEAVGVEGQVARLLRDAADPDRLCRMYVGWAAWL